MTKTDEVGRVRGGEVLVRANRVNEILRGRPGSPKRDIGDILTHCTTVSYADSRDGSDSLRATFAEWEVPESGPRLRTRASRGDRPQDLYLRESPAARGRRAMYMLSLCVSSSRSWLECSCGRGLSGWVPRPLASYGVEHALWVRRPRLPLEEKALIEVLHEDLCALPAPDAGRNQSAGPCPR